MQVTNLTSNFVFMVPCIMWIVVNETSVMQFSNKTPAELHHTGFIYYNASYKIHHYHVVI